MLRSSFCRVLRYRSSRYPENSDASYAVKSAFRTGFLARGLSAAKETTKIDIKSHTCSSCASHVGVTNALQSPAGRLQTSGYHPSHASGSRVMHWIIFSKYQQSRFYRGTRKIKGGRSTSDLELRKAGCRSYSRGLHSFPVLETLIAANVVVFAMWHTLDFRFMDKHFVVSIDSVQNGRLHTILTSAFSQREIDHLLSNLIGLYFFGSQIAQIFGGTYLLSLYLAGAVSGSLGHLFYYVYIYPWVKDIPPHVYNIRHTPGALGASGSVTSVVLLSIFLYPTQTVYFYGVLPIPAALLGAVIIGRDLWVAKQGDSSISAGGHFGGALVAALAFLAKKKFWF